MCVRRVRWCVIIRRVFFRRVRSLSWRVTRWRRWRVFRTWRLNMLVGRWRVVLCWCRWRVAVIFRRFRANVAACRRVVASVVGLCRWLRVRRFRRVRGAVIWRSNGVALSVVLRIGVIRRRVRLVLLRSWVVRSRMFR